jgi:hypothetical protein
MYILLQWWRHRTSQTRTRIGLCINIIAVWYCIKRPTRNTIFYIFYLHIVKAFHFLTIFFPFFSRGVYVIHDILVIHCIIIVYGNLPPGIKLFTATCPHGLSSLSMQKTHKRSSGDKRFFDVHAPIILFLGIYNLKRARVWVHFFMYYIL